MNGYSEGSTAARPRSPNRSRPETHNGQTVREGVVDGSTSSAIPMPRASLGVGRAAGPYESPGVGRGQLLGLSLRRREPCPDHRPSAPRPIAARVGSKQPCRIRFSQSLIAIVGLSSVQRCLAKLRDPVT